MRISTEDAAFLAAMEAGEIPAADFDHRRHVRLAWGLLRRHDVPSALTRIAVTLRGLATAAGRPERYHETITWAWAFLIHERIARDPGETSFARFADANPDLLDPADGLLHSYYSPEALGSETARRTFVMPDRIAL